MSRRLGIDANILVRLAVADDRRQAEAVAALMAKLGKEDALYINISVLLETNWVLRRLYGYDRPSVLAFLQAVLERREFDVADYEAVGNALHLCRMANVDFADALLSELNRLAGCAATLTFDQKAAARVPGMELLA
ncbi:Predicted nucleic-acid-binding protein, contains PIN domain [Rhizobium sp. RU35A]|uniref:PIN domain-containing protein n=1 Tax=Rhizobium sp. RU35A TaxID=1907414 RepID=UPI0009553C5D|nr:type II toxin-antitoxin system VapC family toxin [Rhizobium sp. RU35A]SIQ16717.1 Predicted nucleic-acid-binding protein, contains PIN domain [Rhizobium sp. RU35A]